jgi:hypothetical protein
MWHRLELMRLIEAHKQAIREHKAASMTCETAEAAYKASNRKSAELVDRRRLSAACRSTIAFTRLSQTIPHLTRSSFASRRATPWRLLSARNRRGQPSKNKFKSYPIGYFHIDIAETDRRGQALPLCRR